MRKKKIKASKAEASADEIAVYAFLYLRESAVVARAKRCLDALVKEMKTKHVVAKEIVKAFAAIEISATERQAKMNREVAYLQAIGAPVQLELFEMSVPIANDIIARATEKGRMDAIRGVIESDNAWNAGTEEGQAWLNGHRTMMGLVADYEHRFEAPDDQPPPPAEDLRVDGYDSSIVLKPAPGEIIPTDALVDAVTAVVAGVVDEALVPA